MIITVKMTVLLKTILFINLPEDTVDRIFIKTAKCKLFFALVVEIIPFKFLELSNRKKKKEKILFFYSLDVKKNGNYTAERNYKI